MSKALHPKAGRFVQQRLFAGLSAFVELEQRIADLPDEKSRGDAFEVFTEAYLATQRKHDAETVWPLPNVPTEILGSLQLATQDYGVDGVLKTRLGKLSAYQVKFRTGRPSLTWRELSTFMGLADSPNIHSRILLTNCDELPSVLNDRQGFFCIRGSDLDRLEPDDFKTIEAWLADSVYQAPKKTPLRHQDEALDKILPAFNEHDRVSAIMACGTGKTLVALWVAERMQASRILVLVPSLALLRQILHEWLRETNLPALAYLCVCSDPTVKEGLDAIDTKQSDLDFQVSTDAASVREFLDASFAGVKIIFSTYQSAQVVGAALKSGEAFDLAVFDEAHKTAGREGRNFAFALEDKNISIRKRLFLTATPRHYNPQKRDREGDAQLVFSMDNPGVYGPQAYRLTFAEAARQGIICGYKVIISVITSELVTNELLSRGEVDVNGDTVRARQVANQIALRDAVEKYGASKVFTFHKTVKSAASFVATGSEGVRTHLPDFKTFHVNGTMTTARRERVMRDFKSSSHAVISNARCLTEGVDVPAVDMVAFLSPRRSLVDIVQAVGRAMRLSPGKQVGFILVPLFVEQEQDESIESALARTQFTEVWEVLQTMLEQDSVLADFIRQLAVNKGRVGKLGDATNEQIEFIGEAVSADVLKMAIHARCFEDLFAFWDIQYGKLLEFKRSYGHCRVPATDKNNHQLALWVGSQRKRKGELSADRIAKLESIGFVWDAHGSAWLENFAQLEIFKASHGHCRVSQLHRDNPKLGRWVSTQRKSKDTLSPDYIAKLDAIGFSWEIDPWNEKYIQLEAFKEEYGHCRVPTMSKLNRKLGNWVSNQRTNYANKKLSPDQIAKLEKIGFVWNTQESNWQERFDELVTFKTKHGHCLVTKRGKNHQQFVEWIREQRKLYAQEKLSHERIAKLEGLGFKWNVIQDIQKHREVQKQIQIQWAERFDQLLVFKSKYGHCRVTRFDPEFKVLATWVHSQRGNYSQGILAPARIEKLESIGFEWDANESDWQENFDQLEVYKMEHGHCRVPNRYKNNLQLGSWVAYQRSHKDTMSAERRQRLDALGFVWDPLVAAWEEGFAILQKFYEREHHCQVTVSHREGGFKLGQWASHQRSNKDAITVERRQRLNALGFIWDNVAALWEEGFAALQLFKARKGHCRVPATHLEGTYRLGQWVSNLRRQKGILSIERSQRLEAVGFEWDPLKSVWEEGFAALERFKAREHHCRVPRNHIEGTFILGTWVGTQRSQRDSMIIERRQRLDALGFVWRIL